MHDSIDRSVLRIVAPGWPRPPNWHERAWTSDEIVWTGYASRLRPVPDTRRWTRLARWWRRRWNEVLTWRRG